MDFTVQRVTLYGIYYAHSLSAWCLSVPRGRVRRQARLRLFPDAVLHHERAVRRSVVGVVLDQRRRGRRASHHRPRHRPDAHDAVGRLTGPAAARLLRQGDRHLDVDVPRLRVRVAHRVLHRQRLVAARRPPLEGVGRHRRLPPAIQRRRRRRSVRSPRTDAHATAHGQSSLSSRSSS